MRSSKMVRKTKETDIALELCLDGGDIEISSGIGFFDHMLTALAMHASFGLKLVCKGDLEVDGHHTVEDVGIVLGKAFREAVGDGKGIARYGSFYIPMDEALAFCAVDISGRPFLVFEALFPEESIGGYDSCLTKEFFRAFAFNAGITLHLRAEYGDNSHHIAEALFKACAHALRCACVKTGDKTLSTKGVL